MNLFEYCINNDIPKVISILKSGTYADDDFLDHLLRMEDKSLDIIIDEVPYIFSNYPNKIALMRATTIFRKKNLSTKIQLKIYNLFNNFSYIESCFELDSRPELFIELPAIFFDQKNEETFLKLFFTKISKKIKKMIFQFIKDNNYQKLNEAYFLNLFIENDGLKLNFLENRAFLSVDFNFLLLAPYCIPEIKVFKKILGDTKINQLFINSTNTVITFCKVLKNFYKVMQLNENFNLKKIKNINDLDKKLLYYLKYYTQMNFKLNQKISLPSFYKNYAVIIPQYNHDIIKISYLMNNCVGDGNYLINILVDNKLIYFRDLSNESNQILMLINTQNEIIEVKDINNKIPNEKLTDELHKFIINNFKNN